MKNASNSFIHGNPLFVDSKTGQFDFEGLLTHGHVKIFTAKHRNIYATTTDH